MAYGTIDKLCSPRPMAALVACCCPLVENATLVCLGLALKKPSVVQLRLSGGTVGELLALADRLQIEGVVAAVVPYVIGLFPTQTALATRMCAVLHTAWSMCLCGFLSSDQQALASVQ